MNEWLTDELKKSTYRFSVEFTLHSFRLRTEGRGFIIVIGQRECQEELIIDDVGNSISLSILKSLVVVHLPWTLVLEICKYVTKKNFGFPMNFSTVSSLNKKK